MAKHRTYSIEFKRQVAQEFLAGESLHGLSRRHDVSRNLIRVWVAKLEAGTYDEDAEAADLLQEYEAKIAALERLVGRQALEIEFLKGALKSAPRPRSATTSVIAGPMVSPSPKDPARGVRTLGSARYARFREFAPLRRPLPPIVLPAIGRTLPCLRHIPCRTIPSMRFVPVMTSTTCPSRSESCSTTCPVTSQLHFLPSHSNVARNI